MTQRHTPEEPNPNLLSFEKRQKLRCDVAFFALWLDVSDVGCRLRERCMTSELFVDFHIRLFGCDQKRQAE
jgi:hypothetical protein